MPFQWYVDVSNGKIYIRNSKDALTTADVSATGAANKIVQADNYGFAYVSITGSASIVGGIKVDTSNLADKKVTKKAA